MVLPEAEGEQGLDDVLVLLVLCCFSCTEYTTTSFINLNIQIARQLKAGGLGKPRQASLKSYINNDAFTEVDKKLLYDLEYAIRQHDIISAYNNHYKIPNEKAPILLQKFVETGRCFWANKDSSPLTWGKERSILFQWEMAPNGYQTLNHTDTNNRLIIITSTPALYVDPIKSECGLLKHEINETLFPLLINAPPIPPEHGNELGQKIHQVF